MEQGNQRPRLQKLIIRNFRGIGSNPVEIELDDIVVLVGPNNAGKSSILRAYEVVMSDGSKKSELTLDDFPNGTICSENLPEIILHTIVYDNLPADKWIDKSTGENLIKERWIWNTVGKPKRSGWDAVNQVWDETLVPWGAANVANSRRPLPHKVDAFSDPGEQASAIIKLLSTIIANRVKSLTVKNGDEQEELTDFGKLLEQVKEIQNKIIAESKEEIEKAEEGISDLIKEIFPSYKIKFDARPEDDLEKSINLFKAGSKLLMGPENGYQSTIDRQGSGARRTLLWAALQYISETSSTNERPNVLLLDEPEICLHPNAVREACRVLYELPSKSNWQVMVTTHSPTFVDFSKDNTTIIRVERDLSGEIKGTTLFRPQRVRLDDNDRRLLKLLNLCDPYVAEFFFGGHSIIVEGDTEYTAFKHIISKFPEQFKDVHIIRARGKATIISLVKILNHFGTSYSVLHDSDYPTLRNGNRNPAWTNNQNILNAVYEHDDPSKVRLVATMKNFEFAFLTNEVSEEKPYNALLQLSENQQMAENIRLLILALIDHSSPTPPGCLEWNNLEELARHYNDKVSSN
ncbi:AAA family ATPase [Bacillus sp. AG4(2022)]|uniref:ATP-dependent nuclease n=1 Tax=Bacillus sp. AG4(2022) TaxID=2962594 RepID=UPI002882C0C1|nr:AAA family ATPase [Bacillus sp. AG4(2022)]MDT0159260.1 AAA family ATPase [Bacillus sp. AG4(2022)]